MINILKNILKEKTLKYLVMKYLEHFGKIKLKKMKKKNGWEMEGKAISS